MLYYILPPIIIVLGLSILIFFLFRKVSSLPEGVVAQAVQEERAGGRRISEFFAAVGHFGLRFLERLMQKIKLLSLKFHNTSNDLFHSIRKKRERRSMELEQRRQVGMEKEKEAGGEEEAAQEALREMPAQKIAAVEEPVREEAPAIVRRPRMRAEAPQMVSSRVTHPESRKVSTRAKNKLEDALIKRIAINPKDIEAYERLGDYYIEQDNMSDALECYRQVLRLSPVHYKAKTKIRKIEQVMSRKV